MFNRSITLATAVVLSLPAFVQAEISEGFYLGGSVGHSSYKVRDTDSQVGVDTFIDENGENYGVHVGYAVSENILFELGYKNMLDVSDSPDEGLEREANVDAATLGMIINLPINAGWGMFLSVGYGNYDVDYTLSEIGYDTDNYGKSNDGYYYGAGLNYDLTNSMWVSLAYTRHSFDDETWENTGDIEARLTDISLRLNYQF